MKGMLGPLERIPVRWRIAITTAGLTFLILVVFALILGNLVGDRMRNDFEKELSGTAEAVATQSTVALDPVRGVPVLRSPNLDASAMTEGAVLRIVTESGRQLASTSDVDLGAPAEGVINFGEYSVASEPVSSGSMSAFIQCSPCWRVSRSPTAR